MTNKPQRSITDEEAANALVEAQQLVRLLEPSQNLEPGLRTYFEARLELMKDIYSPYWETRGRIESVTT